jgi:hypothetical protein
MCYGGFVEWEKAMFKVTLSDEELHAVIDFNESMAADATDSCEFEEAKARKARAKELKAMLRQRAA